MTRLIVQEEDGSCVVSGSVGGMDVTIYNHTRHNLIASLRGESGKHEFSILPYSTLVRPTRDGDIVSLYVHEELAPPGAA